VRRFHYLRGEEEEMRILNTFKKGFQATNKRLRMVVYLWLINFVYSVLIVTPVYFLLKKDLSPSLMTDQVIKGTDLLWLGDIIYKSQDIFPALVGWFLIPGIFFMLLYIFLYGGIIGRVVAQDEKMEMSVFLADCSKHFLTFLRVFLISLVAYLVVFGGIYSIISALFNLWKKSASTEWPLIFSSILEFLILVLLFSVVRMFFDYVRVRLVVEKSKKTIRATLLNLAFIGKRFFRAWSLYLLIGLITAAIALIYLLVYQPLPNMGVLLIVGFIWQQIYVLSRMWTKILFYSTEYHFFAGEIKEQS
jgi:hypothetical protein